MMLLKRFFKSFECFCFVYGLKLYITEKIESCSQKTPKSLVGEHSKIDSRQCCKMHHLDTSLFPWTLQLPLSVFLWSCSSQSWNWEMCLLACNTLLGVLLMWWNTMAKSNLLGKGLCGIHILRYVAHHWENSRQQLKPSGNLEAGTQAATMEECCSWACSTSPGARHYPQGTGPSPINH